MAQPTNKMQIRGVMIPLCPIQRQRCAASNGASPVRVGTSGLLFVSVDQNAIKLPNNRIAIAAIGVQRHTQGKVVKRQPELAPIDFDCPHALDRSVNALDDIAAEAVNEFLGLIRE
jgi:hypothetical protein